MIALDYVASALSFGIYSEDFVNEEKFNLAVRESAKEGLCELTNLLKKKIKEECRHTTPIVSGLLNAYTEEKYIPIYDSLNRCNFDSTYADSGGLQIITVGKSITDEIKRWIYQVQTFADYAFCFDEIPLAALRSRSRNERGRYDNRSFERNRVAETAIATGQNIRQQVQIFREQNSKTKVILIVHGNNSTDMLEYYRGIASQLADSDYYHIGGLAISRQSIGVGILENVEMMRAAHLISLECHPSVLDHMHILGIGSLEKLRPAIYLARSGYLDKYKAISYDSSSHTCCFDYGLYKHDGMCDTLGTYKTPRGISHFTNVYSYFHSFFEQRNISCNTFLDVIYGPNTPYNSVDSLWKYSAIRERVLQNGGHEERVLCLLIKSLHTYMQIGNFCTCLDRMFVEASPPSSSVKQIKRVGYLAALRSVKEEKDMEHWWYHYSNQVHSQRIKDAPSTDLTDFLPMETA